MGDFQPEPAYLATNPGGGAGAWMSIENLRFGEKHCPSRRLCVLRRLRPWGGGVQLVLEARSIRGRLLSRTPMALGGEDACTSLCIAVAGDFGEVEYAPRPGLTGWRREAINQSGGIDSVSCPTKSFCVASGSDGSVLFSSRPTAGGRFWKSIHPHLPAPLGGVRCPSESLCLAFDQTGELVTSGDPRNPATWTAARLDPDGYITTLACPSAARCLAADDDGNVLTGTRPREAARSSRRRPSMPRSLRYRGG